MPATSFTKGGTLDKTGCSQCDETDHAVLLKHTRLPPLHTCRKVPGKSTACDSNNDDVHAVWLTLGGVGSRFSAPIECVDVADRGMENGVMLSVRTPLEASRCVWRSRRDRE